MFKSGVKALKFELHLLFTPKSVSFGYRLWNRTWVGAQRSRSGEHTPKPSTYKITEQLQRTEHDTNRYIELFPLSCYVLARLYSYVLL